MECGNTCVQESGSSPSFNGSLMKRAITRPVSFDDSIIESRPEFPRFRKAGAAVRRRVQHRDTNRVADTGKFPSDLKDQPDRCGFATPTVPLRKKQREMTNREEIEYLTRGLYSTKVRGDLPAVCSSFFEEFKSQVRVV